MRIDPKKCVGCMKCIAICCGEAIVQIGRIYVVDEDRCVECYTCLRSGICPENAFEEVHLEWPRILRRTFSSVNELHKGTGVAGRGTVEMKNNDVSGRYRLGDVGFTVDVGRPGVGTTFKDVERISTAEARVGVEFEPSNPTTGLMVNRATGKFRDDIKKERVLSCILEFKTEDAKSISVINTLLDVAGKVDTVFSVGCISRCNPDGSTPIEAILRKGDIFYRPNGKTNVGLGRPLAGC